jgi:hypothetical protein
LAVHIVGAENRNREVVARRVVLRGTRSEHRRDRNCEYPAEDYAR